MKVLHISRTMGQGGAEKVVYQLCTGNNCYDSVVASTGGYYVDELSKNKVSHYIIPDLNSKNPLLMIKTLFILFGIIKKEKINVIHSHHRMAAFYSRILSMLINIPRVYTAHNVFFDKKILLRFSLKGSKIVAVGNGVKQNLVDYYGIHSNIYVIYNSIETVKSGDKNLLLEKLKNENKIMIGNIGRLSEQKGIDVFIKAIDKASKINSNICGIIVGDGEDKAELMKLVSDLNIKDNIYFMGYQKNVLDIIDQLDFVVLSSRWEGLPLIPIETFAERKTIIASNISGNNEIILHNKNGLLFEKDNVSDLLKKIILLSENIDYRAELEKNAYNDYEKRFSYSKFKNDYNKMYFD